MNHTSSAKTVADKELHEKVLHEIARNYLGGRRIARRRRVGGFGKSLLAVFAVFAISVFVVEAFHGTSAVDFPKISITNIPTPVFGDSTILIQPARLI